MPVIFVIVSSSGSSGGNVIDIVNNFAFHGKHFKHGKAIEFHLRRIAERINQSEVGRGRDREGKWQGAVAPTIANNARM